MMTIIIGSHHNQHSRLPQCLITHLYSDLHTLNAV